MTTTAAKRPYFPNYRWVKQAKNRLQYVAKEISGEPNPSYLALEQEIAQWEQNDSEWQDFCSFVESRYGFSRLNRYAIRKNGEHHEPYTAFYGTFSGVMKWISIDEAWQSYTAR